MKMGWIKNNNQEVQPRDRKFTRNAGQLLGQLDDLFPFIYITECGASYRDLRVRLTEEASAGLFAVDIQTGGDSPSIAPRVGLILPISMCRDDKARTALLEIPDLIEVTNNLTMSDRRRAVQAKLGESFGG
jgi:hypothetical protein